MNSYDLYGRIIDEKNSAKKGLTVTAFDSDPDFLGDDVLGKDTTDEEGFFAIRFDNTKFKEFWEFLEGTPEVYLIIKDKEKELLRTEVKKTKKNIIYRIKLGKHSPSSDAPDIYQDNVRKMIGMLNDVGLNMGNENNINLGMLQNLNLAEEVRKRLQSAVDGNDRTLENFNHLVAILNGVIYANLEERGINIINYDGPQVKRNAWKEGDVQAIMWPREESWG